MKKIKPRRLLDELLPVYEAAACSNDGQRCMIPPSPAIREQLVKELKRLRGIAGEGIISTLLTVKQQSRLGLNDGVILPGNVFPLGSSVAAVRAHTAQRTPLKGVVRVIVILIEFPDKKLSVSKKHFEELFFSTGSVSTGSVREYYKEVSNGLIEIEGEVAGPFMMPKKLSYYANGTSGMGDTGPNARDMALDAAKLANPSINFSKYDNDKDGYVDAFVVIHAGNGGEETASKSDIWSHKWIFRSEYKADGIKVYGYLTVPENCKLGVCAHELGHLLFGFPDLYDTDYSSQGIGDWCLMSSGSWCNDGKTPCHPSAWCKAQQDWVTVANQSTNRKAVTIDPVVDSKKIVRLWKKGGPGKEYFLVENRQKKKYDKYLPGSGLLIWHIDDDIDNNNNELHYKVALLQADGNNDLEKGNNSGDAGDPWPGSKARKAIDAKSTPGTLSYGGLDTSVKVTGIKLKNGSVVADLYVSAGAAKPVKKKTVKKAKPKKKAPKKKK